MVPCQQSVAFTDSRQGGCIWLGCWNAIPLGLWQGVTGQFALGYMLHLTKTRNALHCFSDSFARNEKIGLIGLEFYLCTGLECGQGSEKSQPCGSLVCLWLLPPPCTGSMQWRVNGMWMILVILWDLGTEDRIFWQTRGTYGSRQVFLVISCAFHAVGRTCPLHPPQTTACSVCTACWPSLHHRPCMCLWVLSIGRCFQTAGKVTILGFSKVLHCSSYYVPPVHALYFLEIQRCCGLWWHQLSEPAHSTWNLMFSNLVLLVPRLPTLSPGKKTFCQRKGF